MNSNKILRCGYKNSDYKTFSLLIVGKEYVSRHLLDAFQQLHQQKPYNLKLITCETIQEILRFVNEMPIDYIVFVLDIRHPDCVQKLEKDLVAIEQPLICGRMCIVNGIANSQLVFHVTKLASQLKSLKQKLHCPVLSVHIMNPQSCVNLVNQIINLACGVSGVSTNSVLIPWFLDFPDEEPP